MNSFLYWLEHAIFTNQILKQDDGGVANPQVMRPDGVMIPAAVFGTEDKVTYWMPTDKGYVSVTKAEAAQYNDWLLNAIGSMQKVEHEAQAQAFVTELWGHFTLGWDAPKEIDGFTLTAIELRSAVYGSPDVLAGIAERGYSEAEVLGYVQHEAPWAVEVVGLAPA